jgi:hypothetical protein
MNAGSEKSKIAPLHFPLRYASGVMTFAGSPLRSDFAAAPPEAELKLLAMT